MEPVTVLLRLEMDQRKHPQKMPRVNLFTPSLLPSIRSLPFFRHHSVHLLVSLSPYRSFVHLRVYMQRRKEGRKDHVIKCNN